MCRSSVPKCIPAFTRVQAFPGNADELTLCFHFSAMFFGIFSFSNLCRNGHTPTTGSLEDRHLGVLQIICAPILEIIEASNSYISLRIWVTDVLRNFIFTLKCNFNTNLLCFMLLLPFLLIYTSQVFCQGKEQK